MPALSPRVPAGDLPPEAWVEAYGKLGNGTLKQAGQEWNGPCPLCGGDDRFHIGPGAKRGTVVGCRHGCGFKDLAKALFDGGDHRTLPPVPSPPWKKSSPPTVGAAVPPTKPDPVPPPPASSIDLDDLSGFWPYKEALAVYRYPTTDGGHGEVHEVKYLNRSERKDRILCRLTEWGLIYGLKSGEYAQGKDGCWRKAGPKTPPGAPRKRIGETRAALYRPGDAHTPPRRRRDVIAAARESGDFILAVEGPKDADTAAELGLLATSSPGGAAGMQWKHAAELRGLRVAVIGDQDRAGIDGLYKRAKLIHKAGAAEVRMLEPLGGDPESGYDLTDWIEEQRRDKLTDEEIATELRERIEASRPSRLSAGKSRKKRRPSRLIFLPEVEITPHEEMVADDALAIVLENERNLYQRSGEIVHVVRTEPDPDGPCTMLVRPRGAPLIRPLGEARMREILSKHCQFIRKSERVKEDGSTEESKSLAHPPQWAARAILARSEWQDVPHLEAIVEGPVLRPDGSILQEPGYDPSTGILYEPNARFEPVPEKPTNKDLCAALALLREAVHDFPFREWEHFSAWLSSVLTPLARAAFSGPSPLNLIDANVRGAGKSLLADIVATIVSGRDAARMSYTRNEEELRKAITSTALGGAQTVLIDNVSGAFGDPTLDRALTTKLWKDRLLGKNVEVVVPLQITWYATGNNIQLAGDLPRRCLHIRLESDQERPEDRSPETFKHHPLVPWVESQRGRLLPAALTLLRGWWDAGRPQSKIPGWGSFEGWTDVVRQCLVWLDLPDPFETRENLETSSDVEAAAVTLLLAGLDELLRVPELGGEATAAGMLQALEQAQPDEFSTLRQAFTELVPRLKPGQLPTSRQLGFLLRGHRDRYLEDLCLTPVRVEHKTTVWGIEHRES